MYLFFLIFGIVFILTAGIFINYIYEFFPINKITNFIYSTNNNHLFNDISILPQVCVQNVGFLILRSNNLIK